MTFRRTGWVCVLAGLVALTVTVTAWAWPGQDRLIAHEWGTFTTVAGEDGVALDWLPLADRSDLPSFVYSVERGGGGLRGTQHGGKGDIRGTVRMETPVVYFYATREQKVSLRVAFPKGQITEWYPQAQRVDKTGIDWGTFLVMPNGDGQPLPTEAAPSHYYPARATDAAIVRVCGADENQHEKFLFYRGVGSFGLPVQAVLHGSEVQVSGHAAGQVVLFERHGDQVGFTLGTLGTAVHLKRPALDKRTDTLFPTLEQLLTRQGLYPKEAHAMIETWRDQWFEDGLRLFYILPRAATDEALPMTISPQPAELVRVLVGRIEIITPELEAEVVAHLDGAIADLRAKYGRFAEPILRRIGSHTADPAIQARIAGLLDDR